MNDETMNEGGEIVTEEAAATKKKRVKTIKDENDQVFDGSPGTFIFDPSDVIILGLDELIDETDPLHDDGVNSKLDESQVKSVGRDGVIEPIIVTAREINGQLAPVVVDGRNRTRWLRRANELKLGGKKKFIEAKCITAVAEEGYRVAKHSLNYVRAARTTLSQAKAAEELQAAGHKTADIAITLGVSVSTAENFLALATASKPLTDALKKGALPVSAAYKLAKLPIEKQAEAVKTTLAAASASPKGKAKVSDAHASKRQAKGDAQAVARPGIGKVRKILDKAKEDPAVMKSLTACEPVDFLRWLLGDVSDRVLPKELRTIIRGRKKTDAEEE